MLALAWMLLRDTIWYFVEDEALSRGAAIAYYTVVSVAPVLVIVISIAGLVYGEDAARGAIFEQLRGIMGREGAAAIQTMIASVGTTGTGTLGTVLGVGALLVTASGVFGEMQAGLNKIWKADPAETTAVTVTRLVRARAVSLGLVAALAFLLMVSLAVNAAIAAFSERLQRTLPDVAILVHGLDFVLSFVLTGAVFTATYKVLPDKRTRWRDVAVGAVAATLLFTVGKLAIGSYIGSSRLASTSGAAGAILVVLLWVYWSAQIFLLGAEFARVWAVHRGGKAAERA